MLAIDPDNQDALAMMILAITDQFRDEGTAAHVGRAERLLPRLRDAYTQAYYGAIINERRARAALDAGRATMAYEWLLAALHGFDRAIGLRPGRQRRRGAAVECVRARARSTCRRRRRPIAPSRRSCRSERTRRRSSALQRTAGASYDSPATGD